MLFCMLSLGWRSRPPPSLPPPAVSRPVEPPATAPRSPPVARLPPRRRARRPRSPPTRRPSPPTPPTSPTTALSTSRPRPARSSPMSRPSAPAKLKSLDRRRRRRSSWPTQARAARPRSHRALVNGLAAAPMAAPLNVQKIIWAGNQIIGAALHLRRRPRLLQSRPAMTAPGTVSFALHGGHLLATPMDSSRIRGLGLRTASAPG